MHFASGWVLVRRKNSEFSIPQHTDTQARFRGKSYFPSHFSVTKLMRRQRRVERRGRKIKNCQVHVQSLHPSGVTGRVNDKSGRKRACFLALALSPAHPIRRAILFTGSRKSSPSLVTG